MLEVALCVTLYTLVLWIELSPAILEAMHANRWLRRLRHVMFIVAGLGLLLPTMHQSSLGSLLIIAGDKVHPLWQTNIIPLLFLLTAITMGYAMVVFESLYASVNLNRPLETALLSKVSAVIPWLLIGYIALRFGDLVLTGNIGYVLRSGIEPYLFAAEMLLFLYAIVKLLSKEERVRPTVLFRAALAVLVGGSLYRFNAFLIGFDPGPGWHYFPAVGEMMITIGIVAFEIMAYLFFVKKTPVLLASPSERAAAGSTRRRASPGATGLHAVAGGAGGHPPALPT